MSEFEYKYNKIYESNNIDLKVKNNLLKMLEIIESFEEFEDTNEIENKLFDINDKKTDEKGKINIELARLISKKNNKDYSSILKSIVNKDFESLDDEGENVKNILNKNIEDAKAEIVKEELKNDILSNFVTCYDKILDQYLAYIDLFASNKSLEKRYK